MSLRAVLALSLLLAGAAPVFAAGDEEDLGTVPPFSARDLAGKQVSLDELLEEGPVALTFWATWCKPCRKELPELETLAEAYAERGFRVVAVSVDGPVDRAKVRPYVRAQGFTFRVVPDLDGALRRRFQVEVVPTTFLIGPGRQVLRRQVGYRRGDEKQLEETLRKILKIQDMEPDGER